MHPAFPTFILSESASVKISVSDGKLCPTIGANFGSAPEGQPIRVGRECAT
jgi:hypothetical protein